MSCSPPPVLGNLMKWLSRKFRNFLCFKLYGLELRPLALGLGGHTEKGTRNKGHLKTPWSPCPGNTLQFPVAIVADHERYAMRAIAYLGCISIGERFGTLEAYEFEGHVLELSLQDGPLLTRGIGGSLSRQYE